MLQYRLHHSGHCIGLEGHEAPFLDVGENEKIRAGINSILIKRGNEVDDTNPVDLIIDFRSLC